MLLPNRQGDSETHFFLPILEECVKCRNYNSGIALAFRQATKVGAVPASPCFMKRPELMDASTRRFVEALLSPPPRDNWSRKLKATPLRTRANRSSAFQESPETRLPFTNKKPRPLNEPTPEGTEDRCLQVSIQEAIRKEDMVAIRKVVCFGDHPC